MPNISFRCSEELRDELDNRAEEAGLSRAKYIRDQLDSDDNYAELQREHEQLQAKYELLHDEHGRLQDKLDEVREEIGRAQQAREDAENERDRLERKLTAALKRKDETEELVRWQKEGWVSRTRRRLFGGN